jgi:hypothetical protein
MNGQDPAVRDEVRVLDLAENRQLESESLNRFEPAAGDVLDWKSVSGWDRFWFEDETGWANLVAELLSAQVASGQVTVAVLPRG